MLPLAFIAAAAAQDAPAAVDPALAAVRGRKIWMVGAPPADCARVEAELGLVVECDTDWATTEDEVVIWCTEIPHAVGPAILAFLGRSHADVRTHQTNPSAAGTGECGQLFEITVRYPNDGSGEEGGIQEALIESGSGLVVGSGEGGMGFGGMGTSGGTFASGTSGSRKLFGSDGQPVGQPTNNNSDVLAALRGRKIWMVNAPEAECARVESELGMVVECDPTWEALAHDEIVIWCTEIPHEAAPALLSFLGKSHYEVRTHQTNPAAGGTGECGEVFEITVRY